MIRSVLKIKGYDLQASDGEFGTVDDLLIDENLWVIRYLVARCGSWLSGRRVLIPPALLGQPQWDDKSLPVELSKSGIESSPPLDDDAPVSRQFELNLHRYWGLQPYWAGGVTGGAFPVPVRVKDKGEEGESAADVPVDEPYGDPFLRSVREVAGYKIEATDDGIGHVDDFLMDDVLWIIRYLIVDTHNWLPGRTVMIPLNWITDISFPDQKVIVDVTRKAVKNSPEFDPSLPVNRKQEQVLFDYYGRPHYTEAARI